MKKISTVISVFLACLILLAGCGKSENTSSNNDTAEVSSTSSVTDTPSEDSTPSGDSSVTSSIAGDENTSSETNSSNTENNDPENTDPENTDPENGGNTDNEPDPEAPTVYLTAKRDGNTVTVSMNVKNNPGLAAYTVKVGYNTAKVTPKTINATLTTPVTSNLQQPNATLQGKVTAAYANLNGTSEDGELFNIVFEVKENSIGTAEFEIISDENDFVAPDYAYIQFQKQNTQISLD